MLADGYVYEPNGLIYKDFELGTGEPPTDGQQVVFHYSAYNESGGIIDSSYRQARKRNASSSASCAMRLMRGPMPANSGAGAACGDAAGHQRDDPRL